MKEYIIKKAICIKGSSPIYSDHATHIEIDDEGGGTFIVISQEHDTHAGKIRLDSDEVEYLISALLWAKEAALEIESD